jgi:hypothetical protein
MTDYKDLAQRLAVALAQVIEHNDDLGHSEDCQASVRVRGWSTTLDRDIRCPFCATLADADRLLDEAKAKGLP